MQPIRILLRMPGLPVRIFLLLFLISIIYGVSPQARSLDGYSYQNKKQIAATRKIQDSVVLNHQAYLTDSINNSRDSIKAIQDSLSFIWIRKPDPNRPNRFLDSVLQRYTVKNLDFIAWGKQFPRKQSRYDEGKVRNKGQIWVLSFIVLLILLFALIKRIFNKELQIIVESFYNNRILSQINKEDSLFSSWPFVFLYILFGFTVGMFLYLCGKYFGIEYQYNGFQWFIILSLLVIALFTLKIIVLRLIGFLFDKQRITREYISILYLSYFNIAIIYLPIVAAFSLTPSRFATLYIYGAIIVFVFVFAFQFIRAGTNILLNYRLPKVYIILYLCALEICPLIILMKVLRF